MKRADWLDRLWETIEAQRALPFVWGGRGDSRDCCTFAASCLDAMTDGNFVEKLLTHYSDEATAKAYIEGAGGLEAAVTQHLGAPKPLGFMGRGDVAMIMYRGQPAIGICVGANVVCAGDRELAHLPRERALVAWGI